MARQRRAPSAPDVSIEWKRWAALSLLDGEPLADVIATMVDEGVKETAAAATCARLLSDDGGYEAALWTSQQLRKLESILTVRQELLALASEPPTVARRSGMTREEFLDGYYAQNQPVILSDVCDTWKARSRWTVEHLVDVLGDADVEVMADRDSNPLYEMQSDEHKRVVPFSEFAAKVASTARGNDTYLVANNEFLSSDVAAPLWDDFDVDARYLDPERARSAAYLWFGPAGTTTPLHHDALNVLFNQVVGRKRFTLISPLETHCVYNSLSVYSDVDPKAVDEERFPLFSQAHQLHVTLEPGETLFMPIGWWHHVESLDLSMSVSFTNFAFPNDLEVYEPDIAL